MCLLTCDKAGTWDWQHVGLSVATVTTVRPCYPQPLAGREQKRNCWHDRMVLAAFLPQVPGLAHVRSTRARSPVPILDLEGYALW